MLFLTTLRSGALICYHRHPISLLVPPKAENVATPLHLIHWAVDVGRFSSKMCPVMDMSELTLEMMWSAGLQLIVFYHCDAACQRHFQLWPGACIPAPWHETFSCPALLSAVDRELSTRQTSRTSFHVMQGVFTPDSGFIVSHLGQKLLDTLAGQALDPFLDWLRYQKCGPGGINIVTVDFVELTQLVPILLRMNQTMADCLTVTGSSS